MHLLEYYLKAISILLRIRIDYKRFPFASEKEFRIDDIKLKSFEILRKFLNQKWNERKTHFIIQRFKGNFWILCAIWENM